MTTNQYNPDTISPPCETIAETIAVHSITPSSFAQAMQFTDQAATALLRGETPITQSIAETLETLLSVPATFWLKLQNNYDNHRKA